MIFFPTKKTKSGPIKYKFCTYSYNLTLIMFFYGLKTFVVSGRR